MRLLLLSVLALSLSACQILYRLPTRQGNVIDPRDLAKLQVGMTREQVKFVMGTPVAANPFSDDRWDYFAYYKSPRGGQSQRTVSLYFDEQNKLARMDGVDQAAGNDMGTPDLKAIETEARRDAAEKQRTRGTGSGDAGPPTPSGTP